VARREVDVTSTGGAGAGDLEVWLREELSLPPEASVTVSEEAGTDPRCSPVVTRVAIDDPTGDPYDFHIERALDEVTRMDVVAALAFGGGH
jgi:uncharacterized lipoprotein YbaY